MKKLVSIGFAVLYLMITIAVQFVVALTLGVQMMIFQFMNGASKENLDQIEKQFTTYQYELILMALINLILIAVFGLWYSLIRTKRDISPVSYQKVVSAKSLVCTAALAVSCQFVCNIIMLVFQRAFPAVFEQYLNRMEGLDINVLPVWAMLFIVGVWSPFAEELVFRGMVFRTLRKGFSFVPAALMSGAVFGIYHMDWVQGVYAGAFGVLLAYTYEKTNSILGCYFFHLAFNLSSYGIGALQSASAVIPDAVIGIIELLLHIVSVVGMVLLIRQFSKIYPAKCSEKEIEENAEYENV